MWVARQWRAKARRQRSAPAAMPQPPARRSRPPRPSPIWRQAPAHSPARLGGGKASCQSVQPLRQCPSASASSCRRRGPPALAATRRPSTRSAAAAAAQSRRRPYRRRHRTPLPAHGPAKAAASVASRTTPPQSRQALAAPLPLPAALGPAPPACRPEDHSAPGLCPAGGCGDGRLPPRVAAGPVGLPAAKAALASPLGGCCCSCHRCGLPPWRRLDLLHQLPRAGLSSHHGSCRVQWYHSPRLVMPLPPLLPGFARGPLARGQHPPPPPDAPAELRPWRKRRRAPRRQQLRSQAAPGPLLQG